MQSIWKCCHDPQGCGRCPAPAPCPLCRSTSWRLPPDEDHQYSRSVGQGNIGLFTSALANMAQTWILPEGKKSECIGMADQDVEGLHGLRLVCPVEVLAEGCFQPGTISVVVLWKQRPGQRLCTNYLTMKAATPILTPSELWFKDICYYTTTPSHDPASTL